MVKMAHVVKVPMRETLLLYTLYLRAVPMDIGVKTVDVAMIVWETLRLYTLYLRASSKAKRQMIRTASLCARKPCCGYNAGTADV